MSHFHFSVTKFTVLRPKIHLKTWPKVIRIGLDQIINYVFFFFDSINYVLYIVNNGRTHDLKFGNFLKSNQIFMTNILIHKISVKRSQTNNSAHLFLFPLIKIKNKNCAQSLSGETLLYICMSRIRTSRTLYIFKKWIFNQ